MNPIRTNSGDKLSWLDPIRYAEDPEYQSFALDRMAGATQAKTFESWQRSGGSAPPVTTPAPAPTLPAPVARRAVQAAAPAVVPQLETASKIGAPDWAALRAKEDPDHRAAKMDDEGARYARLLAEKRLPNTRKAESEARAALRAFVKLEKRAAFGAAWDDLAAHLNGGGLKGAPHLALIEEFVHGTVGFRLGIMERAAMVVPSNELLAHDLDMARFIARTTSITKDAERAHRVACDLVQRLMPAAKRETTGYAPADGESGTFDQALKHRYTVDIGSERGPTLLREIVIPHQENKTYLIDASMAQGTFGKMHYAVGPGGEKLVGRVTRLYRKGDGDTLPLTAREVERDNALLAHVGSPLAPTDVVVVDGKVITFQKRYAGNLLDLLLNLKQHSDAPAQGVHPLRNQIILYCFEHIAAEMERVHAKGIIHQGIKPENMLYDVNGPPALADYSLAYERPRSSNPSASDILVTFEKVVGSAGYIAPEIVGGSAGSFYNQKVDVFSLGASLAYMTAYSVDDVPFFRVNEPRDMRQAVRTYESWLQRRTRDGQVNGRIDWSKVAAGDEPLDRQARSMHKLGESFANLVFDMLLPDPRMRPSASMLASLAKRLARSANLDQTAIFQVMAEGQKLNRRGRASQVAIDHHTPRVANKIDIAAERQIVADLLAEGKYAEAEGHLRAVVVSPQADAEDNFHLAFALDSQEKTVDAIAFYLSATKLDDAEPWYKYDLGEAYKKIKNLAFAERFLIQAVETAAADDADAETYAKAAAEIPVMRAEIRAKRLAEESNAVKASASGNSKASNSEPKKILQDAQRSWQLGAELVGRGDDKNAEANFREALQSAPDNAQFNFSLGLLLHGQQRSVEAALSLRKAADLEPKKAAYNFAAGVALETRGDEKAAVSYLQRAAEAEPQDAKYALHFGLALLHEGKFKDAEQYFRRAVAVDSVDPRSQAGLGKALLRQGDTAGAAAAYMNAVNLQPTNADYNYQLGVSYDLQHKYFLAEPYLRDALRLEPNNYAFKVSLHNCLFKMNRKSDAKKVVQ